jgi:HEPN domain-containing protein
VDFVLTTDFQSYWQHANEDIQSAKSGCHFGHYEAASFDHYLSAMHAAKLTLATSTIITLACWGNGLTVLLKKVIGNIYIDKMQAICLLEANYNWLNKFVFAKQMMDKAFEGDIIPAEQFAKRGSHATEGVLTSGLFCDIA